MSSVLTSEVLSVEVLSAQGHTEVRVHQAVLDDIAFFHAQRQRWNQAQGKLKVELPRDSEVGDLVLILEQAYCPGKPVPLLSMAQALRTAEVASMLSCREEVLGKFVGAVRTALRTDDDAAALRELCEAREMPAALKSLASKRRKTDTAGPSAKELQAMFVAAIDHDDDALLQIVGRRLKQHSQQGDEALVKVRDILSYQRPRPSTMAFPLALEFLKVHPRFYANMSEKLFSRQRNFIKAQCDSKLIQHCTDFMNLGVECLRANKLDDKDFLAFFQIVTKYDEYILGDMVLVKCVPALVDVFRRLDSSMQVKVCQILVTAPGVTTTYGYAVGYAVPKSTKDNYFAQFAKSSLISTLALEAKLLVVQRIFDLENEHFMDFANPDFIGNLPSDMKLSAIERIMRWSVADLAKLNLATVEALGKDARLKLCARAYDLEASVRESLIARVSEEEADDGNDSF